MAGWTAANIGDLSGRTAVVTGANKGLGFQAALQLAAHGARVVLGCRDAGRGQEAVRRIAGLAPRSDVRMEVLDLADLSSIRRFAAAYTDGQDGLDILVDNAGVMALPRRRVTADGFEMQFGTNHLGHFALTGLLLRSLLERPGARVVTVSSINHQAGRMHFDDLQRERHYRAWGAYNQSKLANLLFALELARRIEARRLDLLSTAAHPGYSATDLQLTGPGPLQAKVLALGNRLFAQSDAQGALPLLYAATAPDVRGGEYFGPGGPGGIRGAPARARASRAARDPQTARRLWEVSAALTGVGFEILEPVAV